MKCAAVIAAAGLSSRMQDFKPLMSLSETSVIKSLILRLREGGVEEIVVVAGYRADALRRHLQPLAVRICTNADYATTKMFDSLCMGIQALKQPYDCVFLTPADVPLVQPKTLLRMQQGAAPIIRPVHQGKHGHPVLVATGAIPLLLAHSGSHGLKGAIAASGLRVQDIAVDDAGITLDADTPEDFLLLRRQEAEQHSGGRLWPDIRINIAKGDTILTPETAQLLEMIEHTGSIQAACACMHISYSTGWRLLKRIEKELGYPLVERFTGGIDGGGSCLTEKAKRLLACYLEYRKELKEVAEALFRKHFTDELHGDTPDALPGENERKVLLEKYGTAPAVQAHCRAVAKRALELAGQLEDIPVDTKLLVAACELHDLLKGKSKDHAAAGAAVLTQEGYPQVAALIAVHHDLPPEAGTEAGLLYLADKLVRGAQAVRLEERFAASRMKCNTPAAMASWRRRLAAARMVVEQYHLQACM